MDKGPAIYGLEPIIYESVAVGATAEGGRPAVLYALVSPDADFGLVVDNLSGPSAVFSTSSNGRDTVIITESRSISGPRAVASNYRASDVIKSLGHVKSGEGPANSKHLEDAISSNLIPGHLLIACTSFPSIEEDYDHIGMSTTANAAKAKCIERSPGKFRSIKTGTQGKYAHGLPESVDIGRTIDVLDLYGTSPEELIESLIEDLYVSEWRKFPVYIGAAVFNGKKDAWELAVKNSQVNIREI